MSSSEPTFPIIYTERLQLRVFDPARPSDYDAVLGIYDSDFIRRTVGNPGLHARDDVDTRCAKFHPRPKDVDPAAPFPTHPWHLIYLRGTDTLVGVISLFHRHPLPYPDLGYAVVEGHMNRGYATEAGKAALRWWTEEMCVRDIWAAAFDTNVVSHRVAQKIGFVDGGSIRLVLSDTLVKEGKAFVQPEMGRRLDGLTIDVRPK
ncbi:uncharacterized protein PV07_11151 [Cladophialophora immunda]|uniref:N-acetyltransferase domain-containing protein n=1 Tax=Cladophialophora immunda TaxID=569365 RepID=A0A0D2BV32_9EURO|nr:uncharacterized protein PV07_11151 [Cladophialophora immunda]KIW22903.1 hypothetical protein PV07_11151 [Cladophialophora immunda]OQU93826.1 Acetyltransferase GNAT domain-containing protein [Cladophialophora immunda]